MTKRYKEIGAYRLSSAQCPQIQRLKDWHSINNAQKFYFFTILSVSIKDVAFTLNEKRNDLAPLKFDHFSGRNTDLSVQ